MGKTFQPMLAAKLTDPSRELRFPVLVSPKLDGIRCVVVDGMPMTRKLKLIPNVFIRGALTGFPALDGELMILGDGGKPLPFNDVQSAVMSEYGRPKFEYWVFDHFARPDLPFSHRLEAAVQVAEALKGPLKPVIHWHCGSTETFANYEERFVQMGFEGIMTRSLNGPYKFGRSTVREGWLTKYKRYESTEFEVVGFVELEHNENEQTRDERGYAKRSHAAGGKVGMDTLGSLVLRMEDGRTFTCGSGFDDALRKAVWEHRDLYVGKWASVKHQPFGSLEAPRFPVFLGFRDRRD